MDTMRDDLAAALDAVAEDDETQNFEETEQEVITDESESTDTETETEDQTPADDAGTVQAEDGHRAADPAGADPAGEADEKPDTRSLKAPVDWSPKEREDWSKIPRHLQEKVMQREQAMQNTMQETAVARKVHSEFSQIAKSYGPILQGVAGDTPMQAVENLFNTAAQLRMGTAQEKATTIANLIKQFDVDVGVLDSALVGEQAPIDPNQQMQQMIDQRLAPIMNERQQQQDNHTQQIQHNARSEVAQFSQQAEFFDHVRHDMADLLDMASKRNQAMSTPEAYAKACAMNPEIQQVLAQRAEHKRVTGGNTNMAGKRNAASSITGNRGGGGGGNGNVSLRDSLVDAWDSQEN